MSALGQYCYGLFIKTVTGEQVPMEKIERLVMSVPEAGAKLGLGRTAAYEAAARGDLPVVKVGRALRVPIVAFERMLSEAGTKREVA